MALSIIFLNVNGLRESSKREGLLKWLRSLPVTVDVVSLQETHCTSDVECYSWFSSCGVNFVLSPGTSRFVGCIILYRSVLKLVNSWGEVPGRSLLSEFSLYDVSFRVLCLISTLLETISSIESLMLLTLPSLRLCGDFNTVFDRNFNRFGSSADDTSRERTPALTRLFDSCCVVDIRRYLHSATSSFTWNR